ncbi:glycosyltransferase family 2 protein [Methylococcus sp. EFPC2]|nr:glycosyltransferase family 2 protein [Methylococcus sp. EFPC2]
MLNWNGCVDTCECLTSLRHLKYKNLAILVVDNGSSDNSVKAIAEKFPDTYLIETFHNHGFAEGNNIGIRFALEQGADFVLLLNNDTVVDPLLVTALVDSGKTYPNAGVLSGKIFYYSEPTRIWYAGGYWNVEKKCFEHIGEGSEDDRLFNSAKSTEFATGCCMFLRSSALAQSGLLDPIFFLDHEDTDLSFRMRKFGWECMYIPTAIVWHKISISFGGEESPLKNYYIFRNRLLLSKRHFGLLQRSRVISSICRIVFERLLYSGIKLAMSRRYRESYWTLRSAWNHPTNRAILVGIRDYLFNHFGPCSAKIFELQKSYKDNLESSRRSI